MTGIHPETVGLPLFAQTEPPSASMLANVSAALRRTAVDTSRTPQEILERAADLGVGQEAREDAAGATRRAAREADREYLECVAEAAGEGLKRNAYLWMAEHLDAFHLFETLALAAARRRGHFGMKALAERVRWEYHVDRGDEDFKINNTHVAYIARELVSRHPSLADKIEFRKTKSEA